MIYRPSLLRGAAAEPCRPCLRRLLHAGAAWRQRQQRDPYVREAARLGYRSRAAFKLLEMDAKKRLLREGGVALDLGAAPGSWTQVVLRHRMAVVALDELPMEPLEGCTVVRGSVGCSAAQAAVLGRLGGLPVDLVLSDISPARSGLLFCDHARLVSILVDVLALARRVLRPGGAVLAKALQGADHHALVKAARRFGKVSTLKPKASRRESAEVYLCVRDFDPGRFDEALDDLRDLAA